MPKRDELAEDDDGHPEGSQYRVSATNPRDEISKENLTFITRAFTILMSDRQLSPKVRFLMAISLWSSPKLRLPFALASAFSHISNSFVRRGNGLRGKNPVSTSMSKCTCERCSTIVLWRFVITVELNSEKASLKNSL